MYATLYETVSRTVDKALKGKKEMSFEEFSRYMFDTKFQEEYRKEQERKESLRDKVQIGLAAAFVAGETLVLLKRLRK